MTEDTTLLREVAVSYRGARRKVASPLRFYVEQLFELYLPHIETASTSIRSSRIT